jgi:thioredoxin-like negative regulator of GroEL
MKFLTSENDIILNSDSIIYFYTSEFANLISDILFNLISRIQGNVICVDLNYFEHLSKRFNVMELPTVLVIKDGQEIKRITGLQGLKDISNLL